MKDWFDMFKDRKDSDYDYPEEPAKIAWVGAGYYKKSEAYDSWVYVGDEPDYTLKVRVELFDSEEDFHKREG